MCGLQVCLERKTWQCKFDPLQCLREHGRPCSFQQPLADNVSLYFIAGLISALSLTAPALWNSLPLESQQE